MRRILNGKIYDTELSHKFLSYPDHDIYQAPDKSFFRVERDGLGNISFTLMGLDGIISFYENKNLEITDELLPVIQDLIARQKALNEIELPF